jgi:hypothetical protein
MERQQARFGNPIMNFVRGTHFRPGGRANYLHILSWLKDADTWAISLPEEMAQHQSEKASVGQVVEKGWLAKLTSVEEIAKIIHYDPTMNVLSVEDPQLVFYLRNLDWPELSAAPASREPMSLRSTTLRSHSRERIARSPKG